MEPFEHDEEYDLAYYDSPAVEIDESLATHLMFGAGDIFQNQV